jgi:hypothetical protein
MLIGKSGGANEHDAIIPQSSMGGLAERPSAGRGKAAPTIS